jgi:hypothetical protein
MDKISAILEVDPPPCARCQLIAPPPAVPATVYCPACAPPTGLPLCPACDTVQHAHPRRANHGTVIPAGGSRLFNIHPPTSPQSEYERQPVTVWAAYPPRPASSRLADLFEMPQAVTQLLAGCDTLAQLLQGNAQDATANARDAEKALKRAQAARKEKPKDQTLVGQVILAERELNQAKKAGCLRRREADSSVLALMVRHDVRYSSARV